jgi:hypothetical protein
LGVLTPFVPPPATCTLPGSPTPTPPRPPRPTHPLETVMDSGGFPWCVECICMRMTDERTPLVSREAYPGVLQGLLQLPLVNPGVDPLLLHGMVATSAARGGSVLVGTSRETVGPADPLHNLITAGNREIRCVHGACLGSGGGGGSKGRAPKVWEGRDREQTPHSGPQAGRAPRPPPPHTHTHTHSRPQDT